MINGVTIDLNDVVLLDDRLLDGAIDGVKAAALYVQGEARRYPPVRRKRVAQYWTAKQRRFFFAALRRGEIDVPYRRGLSPRSERLMQRWAVSYENGGRTAIVGNNASYAPLVHGLPGQQSLYHAGNWKRIDEIAKATGPRAREIVKTVIIGKIRGF